MYFFIFSNVTSLLKKMMKFKINNNHQKTCCVLRCEIHAAEIFLTPPLQKTPLFFHAIIEIGTV